jgi:hypothetical protein
MADQQTDGSRNLRSAYFNDFSSGPTVLLWGDATGMRKLCDFLRRMRTPAAALSLSDLCNSVDGRDVTVKIGANSAGVRVDQRTVEWTIHPAMIEDFVAKIEVLGSSGRGHQYLERGVPNEIPVTVSIGEYPDSLHPDLPMTATKH